MTGDPRRPYVKIRERIDGKFDWLLIGGNGRVMAGGEQQGFQDVFDAKRAAKGARQALNDVNLDDASSVVIERLPTTPGSEQE